MAGLQTVDTSDTIDVFPAGDYEPASTPPRVTDASFEEIPDHYELIGLITADRFVRRCAQIFDCPDDAVAEKPQEDMLAEAAMLGATMASFEPRVVLIDASGKKSRCARYGTRTNPTTGQQTRSCVQRQSYSANAEYWRYRVWAWRETDRPVPNGQRQYRRDTLLVQEPLRKTEDRTGRFARKLQEIAIRKARERKAVQEKTRGPSPIPSMEPTTPATVAARNGDMIHVTELVATEPDTIRQRDGNGMTLLLHAAAGGHAELVARLIESGADPNAADATGRTALWHAANAASPGSVDRLIAVEADIDTAATNGDTPLLAATRAACIDCVVSLLGAGANANAYNRVGETAVLLAAAARSQPLVERLLRYGANPDGNDIHGRSAVLIAVAHADTTMLRALLTHGADVSHPDDTGRTPLHEAATQGDIGMLSALLDAGAVIDPQLRKAGETPLVNAVRNGHVDAVRLLIARGADPMRSDPPATVAAAAGGSVDILKMLIDAGGCVNCSGFQDGQPLFAAVRHCRVDTTKYLLAQATTTAQHAKLEEKLLGAAALHCDADIAALLLESSLAGIRDMEVVISALRTALRRGKPQLVRRLLAAYDPDATKHEPQLLNLAVDSGNTETVQVLLDAGADPLAVPGDGLHRDLNALGFALVQGNVDILRLLRRHVENRSTGGRE